jgi:hypothetical protein
MGFLDELLGGGQRQNEYRDFVNRYDQGHPSEGYTDQEVLERYRDVAHAVPQDQYAQAAQEALARLSPEERASLVKMIQQRAQTHGVQLPEQVGTSPRDLGAIFTDLHQSPGRLRDLLGGGAQSGGGAQAGGGAQSGQAEAGGVSGLLGSPVAKAALAGIAAMVAKHYFGRPR